MSFASKVYNNLPRKRSGGAISSVPRQTSNGKRNCLVCRVVQGV